MGITHLVNHAVCAGHVTEGFPVKVSTETKSLIFYCKGVVLTPSFLGACRLHAKTNQCGQAS